MNTERRARILARPFHAGLENEMFNLKTAARGLVASSLVGATMFANAAVIAVPQELTDSGASVLVIGAAVFAIAIGIKVYKWVRRAL